MNLQKYYNIHNVVFIYFYDISIEKKYYEHSYEPLPSTYFLDKSSANKK